MDFREGIQLIKHSLAMPLPGTDAQYLMAPVQRKSSEEYLSQYPDHRSSSILILLYPDPSQNLMTLLIKRPVNTGVHSGQIAFPGGKVEPEETREMAALREAQEEVGVTPAGISLIGELTSLFIPASSYLVHPFIGISDVTPLFTPSPDEVHLLLPTPVMQLLEMPVGEQLFQTSYGSLTAPYYDLNGHIIWGATAMIISEFRELLRRVASNGN